MFLSCYRLRRNAPSVRQCLRDAQDMHRSVMRMFPDVEANNAREELGVLYRLYRTPGELRLYVQSRDKPDAAALGHGFESVDEPKDIGIIMDGFALGQTYLFDLLASPTKKKDTDAKNSKRVFLADAQERMQWLHRKASAAGFTLEWVREDGQEKVLAGLKGGNAHVTCVGALFRGVLKITEAVAFRKAYAEGIGPEKAYGMGMLLLAPAEHA